MSKIEFAPDLFNDFILNKAFPCQSKYLVLKGGAGSGKSHGIAQKIIVRLLEEDGHRAVLTRKVGNTIRKSQYKLVVDYILKYGLSDYFDIRDSDMTIKCPTTSSEILAVGIDEPEKIKSLADPTMIWFEEPTELTSQEFRQMCLRLRGNTKYYKQAMLTFNPITEFHWLRDEFFPPKIEEVIREKGIATMVRKRNIRGREVSVTSTMIHSTYQDNKFIDDEYMAELEDLASKDPYFYDVYCNGNWGVVGELVFNKPWPILREFPEEFDEIIYGFDWGYHHPSVLTKIGIRDKKYYVYERLRINKTTKEEIVATIKEQNLIEDRNDVVYYDSAEPELKDIFEKYGFFSKPSLKGNNSVLAGIDFMKTQEIFSHIDNTELNKELQTYKWQVDKDGQPIEGKVLKIHDDGVDATRYPIYTHAKTHFPRVAFIT